ncbi:MAG TPA: sulfurtransferase TusA family protein [Ktedonobacterales bacterium]|nr:sulfurtransferase TusA family protein [Ktedonobacterales bacterium]
MNDCAGSTFAADAFYDAGERGCATGALDGIADCMRRLAPNQTLEIRTTDPSVMADLTAWCRLTGHSLVMHVDDRYLIRHK